MPATQRRRVALVLAGGAARGAYEVGVVDYLLHDVAQAIGRDVNLDILCGTSVGAINVVVLAAFADEPRKRATRLVHHWANLSIESILRPDRRAVMQTVRSLFSRQQATQGRAGLLDTSGLSALLSSQIPCHKIGEHLRAGYLSALTVSVTQVATGKTVVFIQRADPALPPWSRDATIVPRAVELRAEHALASAAIPVLFPAVRIDGEYFCDGGLRQNVPLSPARRLGADALIVVNPRHVSAEEKPKTSYFPGPFELLGKTLNALLLDRIDNDVDRLDRINNILEAGTRRYGPAFVEEINREMGHAPGRGIRPLKTVFVRSSEDIGKLSTEFARSPEFRRRARGAIGYLLRHLTEGESRSSDLLSYLLFDGDFCRQLIELGRADAKAMHEELCGIFAGESQIKVAGG